MIQRVSFETGSQGDGVLTDSHDSQWRSRYGTAPPGSNTLDGSLARYGEEFNRSLFSAVEDFSQLLSL